MAEESTQRFHQDRGVDRPAPPAGARSWVLVVLDSCRYDTLVEATPRTILRLGELERRWSYATWTAPSHYNLLCGLMPHRSPRGVHASEYYKEDFVRYAQRLGCPGLQFRSFLPSMYLPTVLSQRLGYRTGALVSLPVLNPRTAINRDFDRFELMPSHNDMRRMLERMEFGGERPWFWLLNVGETHYPYALPGEDASGWPRLHGVHGVLARLRDADARGPEDAGIDPPPSFDRAALENMRRRQVRAVEYLDGVFEELFDRVPPGTWITVTSDHGELFGEDGYFGHGPVHHDKVYEVPFVEGVVP